MNGLIRAAAVFLMLGFAASAAEPVKLATEGAYPPFNYVDDNGHVGGFDVDLGNELCKRAGLDCTWQTNDWDTLISNLTAGNFDAIVADMTITDERKKTIAFTEPYFPPDPSTFITAAGKTYDYAALKGVKIGAQGGTIQMGYLNDHLKADNTIVSFDSADAGIADLRAGNIDMYLAEGSFVEETAEGSGGTLKADAPNIPIGFGPGIGMRTADTELKGKFDAALASAKADGWVDALIAKYFPDMTGGPFFKN